MTLPGGHNLKRWVLGGLAAATLSAFPGLALAQSGCAQEAAAIRKAEGQLPRLEVAPPDDKQIVCITLETNVLFARRLVAHVNQCPRSPLAANAGTWQRTGARYSDYFANRGCKPTIRGFRG